MKGKRGFTLVELLAVIVILGIIALITTSVIFGTVEEAKKGAFKDSIYSVIDSVDYYMVENDKKYPSEGCEEIDINELPLKNKNLSGSVSVCSDGSIKVNNVTDGKYYAGGSKEELVVTDKKEELPSYKPIVPTITASDNKLSGSWHDKSYTLIISSKEDGMEYYYGKKGEVTTKGTEIQSGIGISEQGTETYYAKACNKAGTCSNTAKYIARLDNCNPSVTISGNETSRDNYSSNDITLTAVSGCSESGISYQWYKNNEIIFGSTNSSYKATETGSYTVKVIMGTDKYATSETEVYIDKTVPGCNLEITGTKGLNDWYISDVAILAKANATGASGVKVLLKKEGEELGSNPYTLSSNTTGTKISAVVTTGAGIESQCDEVTIKKDSTTPVTPTITASDGNGTWHTSAYSLLLSESSSTSGIKYYLDGNNPPATEGKELSTGTGISTKGTATYYGKVCNGAGTCSAVASYVARLETCVASAKIDGNGTSTSNYTSSNVVLTASGNNDCNSGVSTYQWYKDGEIISGETGETYEVTEQGTYSVKITYKSGQISPTYSTNVYIDKTVPGCNLEITGTKGLNDWYISDVAILAKANTTGASGVKVVLKKEGEELVSNPYTLSSNTTGTKISAVVTTGAGIESQCEEVTIKKDSASPSAPEITSTDNINSGNWHTSGSEFTLNVKGSSSTSGIDYYLFDENNPPTTKVSSVTINETSMNKTYYARACNKAGTCGDISSYVAIVDNCNPSVTINGDTYSKTNVTLTVTNSGGCSDVKSYRWVKDGTEIGTSSTVTTTGTGTYSVVVTYVSGKTASYNKSFYLDTTVPTVTATWNNISSAISLSATDDSSGLSAYCVSTSNSTTNCDWYSLPNATEISDYEIYDYDDDGTYYVFVKDNAGNISSSSKVVVDTSPEYARYDSIYYQGSYWYVFSDSYYPDTTVRLTKGGGVNAFYCLNGDTSCLDCGSNPSGINSALNSQVSGYDYVSVKIPSYSEYYSFVVGDGGSAWSSSSDYWLSDTSYDDRSCDSGKMILPYYGEQLNKYSESLTNSTYGSSNQHEVIPIMTVLKSKIDTTMPSINLDGVPSTINYGASYKLPTSSSFGTEGGTTTCTAKASGTTTSTTVTNTSSLTAGKTYTITCSAKGNNGKTKTVQKNVTVNGYETYAQGTKIEYDGANWYVMYDGGITSSYVNVVREGYFTGTYTSDSYSADGKLYSYDEAFVGSSVPPLTMMLLSNNSLESLGENELVDYFGCEDYDNELYCVNSLPSWIYDGKEIWLSADYNDDGMYICSSSSIYNDQSGDRYIRVIGTIDKADITQ